jgi:hypothetical protein
MRIEKQSILTGRLNMMDLPVTMEQLNRWMNGRELIQRVMPHLSPIEREFLISGMSPEEQENFFKEKE